MTTPLQRQLRKAADEDLVYEREFDGLFIYTYTPRAVRERVWNKTTRAARGLILDGEGRIVARPFDKFFNMFERPETEPKNFPDEPYTVEEKMDGSLGTVFWNPLTKSWDISTKGSLCSEQADYARENLLLRYDWYNTRRMKGGADKRYTYLTEIIYPENRIVVDYGDWTGLKLIAVRHTTTGSEQPAGRIPIIADHLGMECRQSYPHHRHLESLPMSENMEGYVIRFESGLRVKVKNPWYLAIHRALDSRNLKRILELVEAGEWRAFWDMLPKELQKSFDDLYGVIRTAIWDVETRAQDAWSKLSDAKMVTQGRNGRLGRRDFAVWVQKNIEAELHPIMYSILDGHDWRHHTFAIVKKKLKS